MILNKNIKVFIIYIVFSSLNQTNTIFLVSKILIALLFAKKFKILIKYLDFSNNFLEKKILILAELTKLNQHATKLQNSKNLLYKLIYSLKLIKL